MECQSILTELNLLNQCLVFLFLLRGYLAV